MSEITRIHSKSFIRQTADGVLVLVLLSLPLYLIGYHQGVSPILGIAIAITLGALGAHVISTNGMLPEVRQDIAAFSWGTTSLWLGLLFLGALIYAKTTFGAFGDGSHYESILKNQYADQLKPLSHLLYGAGIWSMAQLLRIRHSLCVTTDDAEVDSFRATISRTALRSLSLMMLGNLALFPKFTLVVLPLMVIGLIHLRDELLRSRTAF